MKRLPVIAAIALAGCAAPQRRVVAPDLINVPCEDSECGTNGTAVTGLRGDHAPTTIRLVALIRL